MALPVLIAHADDEEAIAEKLAEPLREDGYVVVHRGAVLVGESVVEEVSKLLAQRCPVVLCGTVRALGTGWAHRVVSAAVAKGAKVYAVQMEPDAYLEQLSMLAGKTTDYSQDPARALQELLDALRVDNPVDGQKPEITAADAEERYRELVLESCDIIDLANLPEDDRHMATRQLELRRLYVALRVRIGAAAGAAITQATFEELERQRLVSQSSTALRSRAHLQSPPSFSVGDRLKQARLLVVLGDPGAGKSTMIRWIATAYLLRLKNDPDWKDIPDVATLPDVDLLPIIVRCRDLELKGAAPSLDDILNQMLRKAELSEAEAAVLDDVLRQKMKDGKAILLLDGLDEIADAAARTRFCQQLEQINIAFPNAPIVATSRIVGYREMGGYRIGRGFEHLVVADLSPEDKDDFARRWCAVTEPPERRELATVELIQDIHSTDRIEQLTGNPMLLTTMALVKRKVGKLPSRRADLYRDAVEVLLNWRREVDEPVDQREALPQLQYIAYAMCEAGVQQLREDELVALLVEMRAAYPSLHALVKHEPDEFVRLLERRTGILIEAGRVRHEGWQQAVFEFRHLTFQEYLAGLALVSGRFPGHVAGTPVAERVAPLAGIASVEEPLQTSDGAVVSDSWCEALRLCVASCRDDEIDDVLRAILHPLPGENDATRRSRAILASLCLTDEPNASQGLVETVLTELAAQIDRSDEYGGTTLADAARALARSRWLDDLENALAHELERRSASEFDTMVGVFSGMLLAAAGAGLRLQEDDFGAFADRLQADGPEVVKAALAVGTAAAAQVLPGTEQMTALVPYLLRCVRGDRASARASSWALTRMNAGESWKPSQDETRLLADLVRDADVDELVAAFVAAILARQEVRSARTAISARLRSETPVVRAILVGALATLKDRDSVPDVIEMLDDPVADVRWAAVYALGELGGEQSLEALLELADHADEGMQSIVIDALAELGDRRAIPALLRGLEAESGEVVQSAVYALEALPDERAVDRLIDLIDSFIWPSVVDALVAIGGSDTVKKLVQLVESPDQTNWSLTYNVTRALAKIPGDAAQDALVELLAHPQEIVRETAASAIAESGHERAVEALSSLVGSPDRGMRRHAQHAVARRGDHLDLQLLSRDRDGLPPFLFGETIDTGWVESAAAALDVDVDAVRRRYEDLASIFELDLSWQ